MATKFLNQAQLAGTVIPVNTPISASDNGQVVFQKLQGQISSISSSLSINVQTFTSDGTYTPTSGMKYCTIECVGGGGAGGGYTLIQNKSGAGGGGSGGYSSVYATAATIGASQTVTIGTAGAGGTGAGGNGGATSVGTICVANGGYGSSVKCTGGTGASMGTGNITFPGNHGGYGWTGKNGSGDGDGYSGNGAPSFYGAGGSGIVTYTGMASNGNNGIAYGSGGGGTLNATIYSGGNGVVGCVVITEYI